MAEENMMVDSTEVLWANVPQESSQLQFLKCDPQTEKIAALYIEDGELCFEGNMDEAAQMFFGEHVKPLADDYIKKVLSDVQSNHPI